MGARVERGPSYSSCGGTVDLRCVYMSVYVCVEDELLCMGTAGGVSSWCGQSVGSQRRRLCSVEVAAGSHTHTHDVCEQEEFGRFTDLSGIWAVDVLLCVDFVEGPAVLGLD